MPAAANMMRSAEAEPGQATLSLAYLRKMVENCRLQAVSPQIVASDEQARQMTEADAYGHIWHRGDKYYLFMARPTK